ncbi:MAG: glutathione S-transferase [Pseudomonadota bacterium]
MEPDHQPEKLELFYTPDTCALASLIACFEAGLEPVLHPVSFAREEQKRPEYLAINPKGRVPALKVGAEILTETPAILAFLAHIAPHAALAPTDPLGFARVQAFNSYLCSTVHVAHAHRMRGHRWVDGETHEEAMRRKVPEAMRACYAYIEDHAFVGPFVFGDAFTISDGYLFTLAQWMEADGVDPDRFPHLKAHRERIGQRAAVRRALGIEHGLMQNPD